MEKQQSRKLAVILHADIVGSTALVRRDETLAHARIHDAFRRFSETIDAYGGRVHEVRGDALVAEFSRASDAVSAALQFQRADCEHNARLGDEIVPWARVGIALGEEVFADDTVTGSGVVLAQRLEQLAEAGGVVIQGAAAETVPQRMPFDYKSLGEREVKGFDQPIRAFTVSLRCGESAPPPEARHRSSRTPSKGAWAFGAVAILVAIAATVMWWQPWAPSTEPASVERMAFPLPDKPSIAVLPFDNLSGDTQKEYFVDGLTEEVITELSRFGELFVIARNSTFTYKNKPVRINQVAEELGVRYVLEGSVRRTDDSLVVTAQLIDATTGAHIWAERYSKPVADFSALEDEIVRKIVSTVASRVDNVERRIASRKGTDNLNAYELVLQGFGLMEDYVEASNRQARKLFETAISLDPRYSRAHTGLAATHIFAHLFGWEDDGGHLGRAREATLRAIELDDGDNEARASLGWIHIYEGRVDEGVAEIEKSLALNPNDVSVLANGAYALTYQGSFDKAIDWVQRAMRLDPFHADHYYDVLGWAYFFQRKYDAALGEMMRIARPNAGQNRVLAAIYARLGKMDMARVHAEKVLELEPEFTVSTFTKTLPFRDPADREFYLDALRISGLPEYPAPQLPDRASIAVLPFDNLSDDPEQEYFADGMTEDLITDLAKLESLLVIARNTVFTYKDRSVVVPEVARELGVKYILEGSVRRAGDVVRINTQLIDGASGTHIWAERYDGSLADIFSLQDQVTSAIVAQLEITLTPDEQARQSAKYTDNPDAYDAYLRGWQFYRRLTPQDFVQAIPHLRRAVELDPDYGQAWAALASIYWIIYRKGEAWSLIVNPDPSNQISMWGARDKAQALLRNAMRHPTPLAHQIESQISWDYRQYDLAIAEARRAVALNLNDPAGHLAMAWALVFDGQGEAAIAATETALRLDPDFPGEPLFAQGTALLLLGRAEEARATLLRALGFAPENFAILVPLAVAYARNGQLEEARTTIREHHENIIFAQPRVEQYMRWWPFKREADVRLFGDGLIQAGMCCAPQFEDYVANLRKGGTLE